MGLTTVTLEHTSLEYYKNAHWLVENCGYRWRVIKSVAGAKNGMSICFLARSAREVLRDMERNTDDYLSPHAFTNRYPAPCTYAFLRESEAVLFKLTCC